MWKLDKSTLISGQERDPPPTVKAKLDEREDILDIDQEFSTSTAERRKCKHSHGRQFKFLKKDKRLIVLYIRTFDISGQRRDSERRKKEFIVVQSDLWDTNTFQYTCQKSPPPGSIPPVELGNTQDIMVENCDFKKQLIN